jgi:hypothetical protein
LFFMKKKALSLFCIFSFLLLFLSCRKEMDKASWDTEILTPLINASFDVSNILPDSIIQEHPDSSLEIVYQKAIHNFDIGNLFVIPDTGLNDFYRLPFNYTFYPGDSIPIKGNPETVYQLPGIELKTFTVKSGKVVFRVKSRVREVTNFRYSIPCATLAGVPFSVNVDVPARVGNTPGIYNKEFDLSGYVINLTGTKGSQVNTIYTKVQAAISPAAPDTVAVTPLDSLIINNTFSDIVPKYAKGYLGQNTIEVPSTQTDLSFFDRVGGNVKLEAVKFDLSLDNFIGVDARATLKSLKAINTHTNTTVTLNTSTTAVNINRASENGSVVIPSHASFPLTTTNSNIKEMLENLPNKMEYQMKVTMNPLGNISGSNDFIYTDQLLNGYLDLRIPLSFIATNLTLSSVLNFNISSGDNRNINDGQLTLFANNGFPFDASIQMYALQEDGTVRDSIVETPTTIVQAPVNAQLKVTGKRLTKLTIPVSHTKMLLLYDTKKVMLKIKFNTSSQPQYIKIYSDYTMDVKVTGDFNYTLQLQ